MFSSIFSVGYANEILFFFDISLTSTTQTTTTTSKDLANILIISNVGWNKITFMFFRIYFEYNGKTIKLPKQMPKILLLFLFFFFFLWSCYGPLRCRFLYSNVFYVICNAHKWLTLFLFHSLTDRTNLLWYAKYANRN